MLCHLPKLNSTQQNLTPYLISLIFLGVTQAAMTLSSWKIRKLYAKSVSPCATTTEPACLEPVLRNKRSHRNEKPAHRNEE